MFAEQISIDKITTVDLTNLRTVPEETRFFLCLGGEHRLRAALRLSNIPKTEYTFYSHNEAKELLGLDETDFPTVYYPHSNDPSRYTIVLVSHIDLNDLTKLICELEK